MTHDKPTISLNHSIDVVGRALARENAELRAQVEARDGQIDGLVSSLRDCRWTLIAWNGIAIIVSVIVAAAGHPLALVAALIPAVALAANARLLRKGGRP